MYQPPWELLDEADFSRVDRSCAELNKSVLAVIETHPFERMRSLRGTETISMDLAYGSVEISRLRDMPHDFSLREIGMLADTDVDAVPHE